MVGNLLETMRADFALVSAERLACHDWAGEDVAELGVAIKAAVDGGDAEAVASWVDYLATEAAPLRARAQACREAEARIRAQRAAERELQEGRVA